MRAHGINVPDPAPGAHGYGRSLLQLVNSYPHPQVSAAQQACRPYLARAFAVFTASPAQQAQRLRQLVLYAACMRSHGIDVPDPRTGGAPGSGAGKLTTSVTRNSPAFTAAHNACRSLKSKRGSTS
jgi:hypothetical protein